MKKIVFTESYLYLDYRINKEYVVANLISACLRDIFEEYGVILNIKIKKIKHLFNPIKPDEKITIINGLVRNCCLKKGEEGMLYPQSVIFQHLHENWYDYEIEFEREVEINE